MSDWHILIELDLDGEKVRLSDIAGSIDVDPGDGGAVMHFGPGLLEVQLPPRSIDPLAATISAGDSASVRIATEVRDVWQRVNRQGVRLQRSKGRIWVWEEGTTLTEAVELMRGELRSPAYNLTEGAFACQIAARVELGQVQFPDALVGDTNRFPNAPTGSLGAACQVVYGTVQALPLPTVIDPTTLDPPGTDWRLMVAGHRLRWDIRVEVLPDFPLTPQAVILRDNDGTAIAGNPYEVAESVDGLGNAYTYVTVPDVVYSAVSGEIHAQTVEGYPGPDGITPMTSLADVLSHLWHTYSGQDAEDLDLGRCRAAAARLSAYTIAAAFDSPAQGATLLDAIASRIASVYPVVFGYIGGRFGWDAIDLPTEGETQPAARVVFGVDAFERGEIVETSSADVRNRFRVTYGFDGFEAQNTGVVNLDAETDGLCRRSQNRWGPSAEVGIDAFDARDSGTAHLIAANCARRLAMVRWRVAYKVRDVRYLALPLLSVLEVDDPEAGWSCEPFILEGTTPSVDGTIELALLSVRGM